ncbi:MAG: DDE-type integrase/transposase/recombinase [Candidatus Aenigmarchaeota archaeon]|nr:DDE-type integrase/transposase/recombinase [Candidatus Aenigmarchaeota archaeon]
MENDGFKNKHKSSETIVKSIQLATKLSLREAADFMEVCKNTIFNWLRQYSHLLYSFLKNHTPSMCDVLHMDELFLKMKNKFFYIWDSITKDTRFASWFLSEKRDAASASALMNLSPMPMKKLITDGSFSYIMPVKLVYGLRFFHEKYHRCASFEDKKDNNLVERLQNTLRRYLHFRRGFKGEETGNVWMEFLWVYYNFIRRHMAIGMTPAEKAGLINWFGFRNESDRFLELIRLY